MYTSQSKTAQGQKNLFNFKCNFAVNFHCLFFELAQVAQEYPASLLPQPPTSPGL